MPNPLATTPASGKAKKKSKPAISVKGNTFIPPLKKTVSAGPSQTSSAAGSSPLKLQSTPLSPAPASGGASPAKTDAAAKRPAKNVDTGFDIAQLTSFQNMAETKAKEQERREEAKKKAALATQAEFDQAKARRTRATSSTEVGTSRCLCDSRGWYPNDLHFQLMYVKAQASPRWKPHAAPRLRGSAKLAANHYNQRQTAYSIGRLVGAAGYDVDSRLMPATVALDRVSLSKPSHPVISSLPEFPDHLVIKLEHVSLGKSEKARMIQSLLDELRIIRMNDRDREELQSVRIVKASAHSAHVYSEAGWDDLRGLVSPPSVLPGTGTPLPGIVQASSLPRIPESTPTPPSSGKTVSMDLYLKLTNEKAELTVELDNVKRRLEEVKQSGAGDSSSSPAKDTSTSPIKPARSLAGALQREREHEHAQPPFAGVLWAYQGDKDLRLGQQNAKLDFELTLDDSTPARLAKLGTSYPPGISAPKGASAELAAQFRPSLDLNPDDEYESDRDDRTDVPRHRAPWQKLPSDARKPGDPPANTFTRATILQQQAGVRRREAEREARQERLRQKQEDREEAQFEAEEVARRRKYHTSKWSRSDTVR